MRISCSAYGLTLLAVNEDTDEVDRFKLLLLAPKFDELVLFKVAPVGRIRLEMLEFDSFLGVLVSVSSRLFLNGRQFIKEEVTPELDFFSFVGAAVEAVAEGRTRKLDDRPRPVVPRSGMVVAVSGVDT